MSTTVSYVVRTRIHGYSGMGWEGETHRESSFSTETAARERMAAIQRIRTAKPDPLGEETPEDELEWDLTDGRSFHFKGDPVLIKRTVTEEVIT